MNQTKYIGMDVHVATTVIAIRNSDGKVVTEAIIETKASTIKDFWCFSRQVLLDLPDSPATCDFAWISITSSVIKHV